MAHRNDQLGNTQTYLLKFSAISELLSRFIRAVRQKLDIFPYASGKPLRPYYEQPHSNNQPLSEALIRSQIQFR